MEGYFFYVHHDKRFTCSSDLIFFLACFVDIMFVLCIRFGKKLQNTNFQKGIYIEGEKHKRLLLNFEGLEIFEVVQRPGQFGMFCERKKRLKNVSLT